MPYTTLTMYLSDEQKDRDSATVYSKYIRTLSNLGT